MKPYVLPFVVKPELEALFAAPAARRAAPPRSFPEYRRERRGLCPYHSMPPEECGCLTENERE